MPDAFFIKTNGHTLVAASDHDKEVLGHIKMGQPTRVKFTRVRNYEFHKKFFALLNFAFEHWEPPEVTTGMLARLGIQVEKNFDRFRKDIIILAGFYDATHRLNDEVRIEAKSIAFHNMSEDQFELLYGNCIDVIIKHVLKNYSGDQLRAVVEQVEAFE